MNPGVLQQAFAAAAQWHSGQVRKGTDAPYLCHVIQVAGIVMEFGGSEAEVVGALLHDAAEDAGGERVLEEIESRFGEEVARIVRENSDSLAEDKANKPPWRDRKIAYIESLPDKSVPGLLVCAADKLHNVRALASDQVAMGDSHWTRFKASKGDTLWYYRAVAEAIAQEGHRDARLARLSAELNRAVGELEAVLR